MTDSPDQPPLKPHRSARNWIILVIVWAVGVVVWSFYIAAIVALFVHIFG